MNNTTKLITRPHASPKTIKSLYYGYANFIMYLAPWKISGFNTCSNATDGCINSCLYNAGRGRFSNVQQARINRTRFFYKDRNGFLNKLHDEIQLNINWAIKRDLIPVFRLNGTSDIRWELYDIIDHYPEITFYDYTKIINRVNMYPNYHLTFSRAESNQENVLKAIDRGLNVAAVFNGELPKTYLGRDVINGDKHDLRFLDPNNIIVGLSAKGPAKKDTSGFVIHNAAQMELAA